MLGGGGGERRGEVCAGQGVEVCAVCAWGGAEVEGWARGLEEGHEQEVTGGCCWGGVA